MKTLSAVMRILLPYGNTIENKWGWRIGVVGSKVDLVIVAVSLSPLCLSLSPLLPPPSSRRSGELYIL